MGELMRDESDEAEAFTLVQSAALDFSLPVIAAMSGWLPLILLAAGVRGGRAFAGAVKAQHVRAELDGLRAFIEQVERRLRRDLPLTHEHFLELLQRPDMLKLLAQARDEYAVAQMGPNLVRLAAVIAGRSERRDDDLEKDLRFARAAVDLPDEAVRLLDKMERQGDHAVKTRATADPDGHRYMWGEVHILNFLNERKPLNRDDVNRIVVAIATAERHGFIMRAEPRSTTSASLPSAVATIRCGDGTQASFPNHAWWPTKWGLDFIRLARDSGESDSHLDGA
jgi:hypothetical protein